MLNVCAYVHGQKKSKIKKKIKRVVIHCSLRSESKQVRGITKWEESLTVISI